MGVIEFPERRWMGKGLSGQAVYKSYWKTQSSRGLMYAIEIFYSEEDEGFIAIVPELPGCSAFGETEEMALHEVKIAMKLWLDTAKEIGRTIPVPEKRSLVAGLA
jgi:predicted RNase H-like HicB family nuclease